MQILKSFHDKWRQESLVMPFWRWHAEMQRVGFTSLNRDTSLLSVSTYTSCPSSTTHTRSQACTEMWEHQTAVHLQVSQLSVLWWAVPPLGHACLSPLQGAEIIVSDIRSVSRSKVTPARSNLLPGLLQANATAKFWTISPAYHALNVTASSLHGQWDQPIHCWVAVTRQWGMCQTIFKGQ